MTPFELNIYAKSYSEKLELDHKNNVLQAYLISRWVWQKSVDIKKYLNPQEKNMTMTDSEMLQKVKVLNALMGGVVTKS